MFCSFKSFRNGVKVWRNKYKYEVRGKNWKRRGSECEGRRRSRRDKRRNKGLSAEGKKSEKGVRGGRKRLDQGVKVGRKRRVVEIGV